MAADDRPDPTRREVLAAGAVAAAAAIAAQERPAGAAARSAEPKTSASPKAPPRIDFACRTCGGTSVTRDAWAEWDVGTHDWVLGAAFDYAYCHDCDKETTLEKVPAAVD